MARHRAPVTPRRSRLSWLRSWLAAPREPEPEGSVVLTEVPSQPRKVRLDYPDGTHEIAGWRYGGPEDHGHEKYILQVPATARVVNGMIVHADRDVQLAVEVVDRLPLHARERR